MAAADRRIGTNTVIRWTPTGGSVVTISADYTTFNFSRQTDMVDVTAGNETSRFEKPTIESLDWSISMFDSNPAYKADLVPQTTGLLEILPDGVGSGLEIISFNALIGSNNSDHPFDGAVEISIDGVRQGAMIQEVGTTQT